MFWVQMAKRYFSADYDISSSNAQEMLRIAFTPTTNRIPTRDRRPPKRLSEEDAETRRPRHRGALGMYIYQYTQLMQYVGHRLYLIHKIYQCIDTPTGRLYLVAFQGYDVGQCQWIPEGDIDPHSVAQYWKNKSKKED